MKLQDLASYNRSPKIKLSNIFVGLNTPCFLILETLIVTTSVICLTKYFSANNSLGISWLIIPAIMAAFALCLFLLRNRSLDRLGFTFEHTRRSLPLLFWTCLSVFPLTFCCLWLIKSYGLAFPLKPTLVSGQDLLSWLFYQFFYIAVAEELFFRGYVQNHLLSLTSHLKSIPAKIQQFGAIIISAVIFAAVHFLLYGGILSVLTFLPGLILGWLFIRTKSIIAPILFHGLANVFYLTAVEILA